MAPPSSPASSEADCPECREQKDEAAARARASEDADDPLRLGECKELYDKWAECIDREQGQAKACTAVLKEFKACHNKKDAALSR